MNFSWHVFINLGIISIALLTATVIRVKVKFFQKYLIPNALTAGFLLLLLYNYVFPVIGLTSIHLGQITYHFLGLSFIALTLRQGSRQGVAKNAFPTSVAIISQIALQAFIGLILTLVFISTIMPDLFHSFGFMLPLGFAEGPGQAFSIGEGWKIYGVENAGSIGLTFAAIGFVFCSFGGIFLIHYALRRGWVSKEELANIETEYTRTGIRPKGETLEVGASLKSDTEAIDSFSLHMALVLTAYLLSWLLLKGIGALLGLIGPLGTELATNLWGINFIFAAFMGLFLRFLLVKVKADYVVDNKTLTRITGLSVDIMVTSAVAAISLVTVWQYWFPILLFSVVGAVTTYFATIWFCSRLFYDHRFLRTLLIFGVSTGTLSTGLALLRAVDPEFESPVARDYAYASGLTFFLVIPLILVINLPLQTYKTGDMVYSYITLGVVFIYLLFVAVSYGFIARKRALDQHNNLWYRPRSK